MGASALKKNCFPEMGLKPSVSNGCVDDSTKRTLLAPWFWMINLDPADMPVAEYRSTHTPEGKITDGNDLDITHSLRLVLPCTVGSKLCRVGLSGVGW